MQLSQKVDSTSTVTSTTSTTTATTTTTTATTTTTTPNLDGLVETTAGKTCKAIKLQYPDSKNGFYWVAGPNNEFATENGGAGPKKVFCWQEGRDGGGWTLGLKHWHGAEHNHFDGNGMRETNSIDSGVMQNLGQSAQRSNNSPKHLPRGQWWVCGEYLRWSPASFILC